MEFSRDGEKGILVEPGSSVAVAEALIRLLTQPDLGWRMGERGWRLAMREDSFGTMVGRIAAMLALPR